MPDDLVTIERFRDLPQALLAKGKLQAAGIECFLADAELVRTDWFWSNAIGNMRLQVRANDRAEALELLHEPAPEIFIDIQAGQIYQQPHCPQCDSRDIAFESINRAWTYALMLVGIAIPVPKNNWKCYDCGCEWVEDREDS